MQAIKDYENNKWKVIGQKVGKPAKVRTFFSFLFFAFPFSRHRLSSKDSTHIRITADTVASPFTIYFHFSLRCPLRQVMAHGLGPH